MRAAFVLFFINSGDMGRRWYKLQRDFLRMPTAGNKRAYPLSCTKMKIPLQYVHGAAF